MRLNCDEVVQDKRIQELIDDLGLHDVSETIVGSDLKKTISGGERKRAAIGVELIGDPRCVLLDEPTSGLDSFTAVRIVRILQKIARKRGKTIISTIHQPSSQAFSAFDRLILMADGHIVYQGDARDSMDHFNQFGITSSKYANPADIFMRILAVNYPKTQDDEKRVQGFIDHYMAKQGNEIWNENVNFVMPALKELEN